MEVDNVNFNLIGILFCGIVYMGEDINSGIVSNGVVEFLVVIGLVQCLGWVCYMVYDNIFCDGLEMLIELFDVEGIYILVSGQFYFQLGIIIGEGINCDFFIEFWVMFDDECVNFDFYNLGGVNLYIDFMIVSLWLVNLGDEMWLGGIFDQVNSIKDEENYL